MFKSKQKFQKNYYLFKQKFINQNCNRDNSFHKQMHYLAQIYFHLENTIIFISQECVHRRKTIETKNEDINFFN